MKRKEFYFEVTRPVKIIAKSKSAAEDVLINNYNLGYENCSIDFNYVDEGYKDIKINFLGEKEG